MSEQAKVRLVRCPKCENLLPELTDYSVYQCGGCGAVLRATSKNGELNKFVEKSEEEAVGGIVEKLENFDLSEKNLMNMDGGAEYDVKSNTSSSSTRERRRALRDASETYRTNLRNVADNWGNEDYKGMYKTKIDEQRQQSIANEFEPFDSQNEKEIETRGTGRVIPYRNGSQRSEAEVLPRARRADREGMRYSSSINSEEGPWGRSSGSIYDSDKRLYRKDVDGFNQDEQIQEDMAEEFELLDSQKGKEIETRSTGRVPDWRSKERSEAEIFPRARRVDPEGVRYASSINSEEGPSGYWSGSNYDNDKRLYRKDVDEFSQVDCPVDERAELLRKFDELKEQLSRFDDVSEKPKERIPLERRMAHHEGYGNSVDRFPESSTRIKNRALGHNPVSGERPYLNHSNAPSPFMNARNMADDGFYPPREHMQGYGGLRRSQLLGGDPYQAPAPFQLQPSQAHFPGRSMDNEIPPVDPYRPHLPQTNPHHPSCNCLHCYDVNQIRYRGPLTAFGEKRFSDNSQNPMFYQHQNSAKQDYIPRNANPLQLKPQNSQSQMAHSDDLNSAVGGYARRHPPRVRPRGQQCLPVAGGAPFLTCFNCFQLLQLPKEVFHGGKRQKMKCGACSTVMVIAVSGNKLAVSIDERVDKSTDKMGHQHRVMLNEGNRYSSVHTNRPSMTFSSEDYDTSKYDFHAMDQELRSLSTGRGSSIKSAEMRSLCSTSSRSSRDEDNLNKLSATMEKSDSELPKGKESPPPAGSPLQEYFDYSNKYHVATRLDHGNRSARSDAEKLMQKKTTSQQNSTKDVVVATEMDIPSNEYCHTGSSFETGGSSKEGDQLKSTKASFFSGMIKNSFKEFSRSNSAEEEKANVTVNGHLITDRLIKRAEKRAGPIQPGHYWYDFRAGFWGVIGGPCLGIIPPFIEEFNYPLPDKCAGGSTGVFVNGRELNPKDLKLLASRGLPADREGSYILEISGRVLDEDSGEELESLGKLAPTVEKAKRGFGMRPPKVAA